jgi:hypothetical protein
MMPSPHMSKDVGTRLSEKKSKAEDVALGAVCPKELLL